MDWIATIGHSWLISLAWLVGLALVFGVAARLMPCNPGMYWWQNLHAVSADFMYWFLGPLIVRFGRTILMTAGMALLFGRQESWASPLKDWPLWQQCLAIQLIQDVMLYWIHRAFHTRLAWDFHAVHHSPTVLDWMSTSRSHFINVLMTVVLADVVVLLMGFSPEALMVLVPFNIVYSSMVHANLNWTFGPLRYVLASPVFHRWHHTTERQALNKNFAPTFPFLDLAFGTFYMPQGVLPQDFGNGDAHFPEDFWGQLLHPFRPETPTTAAEATDAAAGRVGWSWSHVFGMAMAATVVGLMAFSVVHGHWTKKRDEHSDRAQDYFFEKEYDRAIAETTEAIKQDPQCALAYANRGAARLQKGDTQKAIEDCSHALDLDPKLAVAYANRAGAYLNSGNLDLAAADCDRALDLDPKLALAHTNRAGVHLNRGAFAEAVNDCTQALACDPNLQVAYFIRAGAYFSKGDDDNSIKDWNEVLKRDPEMVNAYANRATAYLHKGKLPECIDDYTEALRRDPKLVVAYLNRGAALIRLGNAEAALRDFTEAIRLEPTLAIAHAYRGTVSLNMGNTRGAIDDCTKAIEINAGLALAYWTRSLAHARQGQPEKAQADQQKAIEIDPSLAGK